MFRLDEFKNQRSLFASKRIGSDGRSELSGRNIDLNNVCCYAHILPKGSYPHLKLVAKNIILVHPDEHTIRDQGTVQQEKQYKERYPDTNWETWDLRKEEMLEIHALNSKSRIAFVKK